MSIFIRVFNQTTITQRQDGYIDATAMCKACRKLFGDWNRLNSTNDFLNALSTSTGFPIDDLTQVITTGLNDNRGTWIHQKAAINLAQWFSPEFSVQVSDWVFELMITGKVDITQTKLSTDYITALEALVISEK